MTTSIQEILESKNKKDKRALFAFDETDSNESVVFKFNLWARYLQPKYFHNQDAPFHNEIDNNNIKAYRGQIDSFTDIVFRGGAKTTRTKLFIAYCIANDLDHFRKYIKVLSADIKNGKQIVTDIYNIFVQPRVIDLYPEIFEKTTSKREETMSAFTTATGIKLIAGTVGQSQRGALQEDSRPDLILFEDIETRETLRSAVITQGIWDNMEEAKTSLAKGGAMIYNCNYVSEAGNVHKLVLKESENNIVLIVPIIDENGEPAWGRYTKEDISALKQSVDDFEGEYMCNPASGDDVLFERRTLDEMKPIEPIEEVAGFKIFKKYDPSHRYGSGHDVAGGVGLDSSASVFIDFDTIPAQVVGTFHSNKIHPEAFGDEIYRESKMFGLPINGIENNKYDQAILKAKLLGCNLYRQKGKETRVEQQKQTIYGWNTNSLTKSKMLLNLSSAVNDGLLNLNDKDLIQECKSYTRHDLIDKEADPRLTTRHFDLLMALAIAWQMKDEARPKATEQMWQPPLNKLDQRRVI